MKDLMGVKSTLLIVDDNIEMYDHVVDYLKKYFDKVLTASSGSEALIQMASHTVDVVVTDFKMPQMNGYQLYQEIRKRYPLTPVLFLTGDTEDPAIIDSLKEGIFDVLEKTYNLTLMVNRIQNALIYPELIKIVWAIMNQNWSAPKVEDFLKLPMNEQLKTIHAFGGLIKTKSLIA